MFQHGRPDLVRTRHSYCGVVCDGSKVDSGRMEFMPLTTRKKPNLWEGRWLSGTRDVEGGMQRGYALVRSAREKGRRVSNDTVK